MSDLVRSFERLLARHSRTMRNIVARGVLQMVNDGTKMQSVQVAVLDGELIDGAERAQNYGFSSNPLAGAEAIVVCVGADRSHPVIIVADDRGSRATGLQPGEVKVYTHEGDYIHLMNQNKMEFKTRHLKIMAEDDVEIATKNLLINASAGVEINTPDFAMGGAGGGNASAALDGGMTATEDFAANSGAVSLRGHVHDGVQPGNGSTSTPAGG